MALLGKKLRSDGVTAVVSTPEGGCVATVVRVRGDRPRVVFQGLLNSSSPADLRRLLERTAAPRYRASALLTRDDYQLLLVEAPDVRPEELRAAVRWRIKDLIGFHVDDAVIDVFEIPDQRHANRNRMMYAVAAKSKRVSESAALLDDAGLAVDVVDIPEMAVRNLAVLLEQEARGLALIHMTADSGIITISRQGTLYLTRRLDTGTRLLQSAEGVQRERLCEAVLLEVQRSLDYYESHFSHGPVSALALTPTVAATPLASYLPEQLEVTVLQPALDELLEFEQPSGELDGEAILAIGAALRQEAKSL